MDRAFIDDFLNGFDDSRYPGEFLQTYEPMECLANNPVSETLLVKHCRTGQYYVAKCYDNPSLLSHATESELLRGLQHAELPAFVEEYRNDNMICVVREYVPGTPLDRLVRGKPLTEGQIISIGLQLCDVLIYLHGQTPPVIHRDIKPQNIIVDESGTIKLIDFGISRIYNASAQTDTVFYGTQGFAPPEQYGYSQTDSRSDIFSLGVLLCWLLTGETDMESARKKIKNKRLAGIIRKCVSFAPKDRYHSAKSVRRALAATGENRQKRVFQICCAAVALLFAASVGFVAGRFTDIGLPASGKDDTVVFNETLMEQAVRLQLGKGDNEKISVEELMSVTELYVFGDKPAADQEMFAAYNEAFAKNDGSLLRGSIASLSDAAKLKNLRRLSLAYQNISDLSPLSQLANLEEIELKHNPIQDVSPLSKLTSLTGLFLYDTDVSDLTSLDGCPRLTSLDAGDTLITSMTALDGLDSLTHLMLNKTQLQTLDHTGSYPMLEQIYLSGTPLMDLAPLLDLPRLKLVEVDEDMREAAQALAGKAAFEITFQK